MPEFYRDDHVTLLHGHALDMLKTLPDGSVNCCVTSPPYFGLRDYGEDGQYGLEKSPAEYVEAMRELFAEVRRVLADDGTLWLNLGDSYVAGSSMTGTKSMRQRLNDSRERNKTLSRGKSELSAKNLLGIPWRVAFALQDDSWILRNAIVWSKPNAMPESVTDRLSTRHELIFLFSKKRRYWFDLDPIREPAGDYAGKTWQDRLDAGARPGSRGIATTANPIDTVFAANPNGRNPGDVWTIPTQPFPGAHFAVFPVEIPRRCIAAGCKPGGTVLDPFSGSGTTGLAAGQLGRKYIGIDLSRKYLELSLQTRLAQTALIDGGAA